MIQERRHARSAGVLYLATFVTSIPALALKVPILADPGLAAEAAPALALRAASVLEVVLAVACVGTAVALWPLVAPHGPARALGFVAARTVEAGLILVGIVAMQSLLSAPPPDAAVALVSVHDWAFLLGPGLVPAVNALLLGSLLRGTPWVPRVVPWIGLVGAPLLTASALGTIAGVVDQVSPLAGLLALPVAVWELSVGLWLTFRGPRKP